MKTSIKRLLFTIALIFIFYFGFMKSVSDAVVMIVISIMAGLKLGDWVVWFSAKVFPYEEEQ